MKRDLDGDWDDSEVAENNVALLVERAEKALGRQGIKPRPTPLTPEPPSTQNALKYVSIDPQLAPRLAGLVADCRKGLWGHDGPLFSWQDLGLERARQDSWAWLEERVRVRADGELASFNLSATFATAEGGGLQFAFNEWYEELSNRLAATVDPDARRALHRAAWRNLADLLTQHNAELKIDEELKPLGYEWPAVHLTQPGPYFSLPQGGYTLRVPEAGPFAELYVQLGAIAKEVGWWDDSHALEYVLTDHPVAPLYEYSWSGKAPLTLTITAQGPITAPELLNLYKTALEKHGTRAVPLTITQLALLQLKARTPDMTWRERLALFATWREEWLRQNPNLKITDYSRMASGVQAIREEWERAVAKAYWNPSQDGRRRARSTNEKSAAVVKH